MDTVWDTEQDAAEFAAAMRSFVGTHPATVAIDGKTVTVTFASDATSLGAAGES
jgi:hypothetical protein